MITGSAAANDLQGGNGNIVGRQRQRHLHRRRQHRIKPASTRSSSRATSPTIPSSPQPGLGPERTNTVAGSSSFNLDGPVNRSSRLRVTGTASAGMSRARSDPTSSRSRRQRLTGGSCGDQLLGAGGDDLLDGGSAAEPSTAARARTRPTSERSGGGERRMYRHGHRRLGRRRYPDGGGKRDRLLQRHHRWRRQHAASAAIDSLAGAGDETTFQGGLGSDTLDGGRDQIGYGVDRAVFRAISPITRSPRSTRRRPSSIRPASTAPTR